MLKMKSSFRDHLQKSKKKNKVSLTYSTKTRRRDGLCLDKCRLLTAIFETEIGAKKTMKYSFDVQVDLKAYLSEDRKLPEGASIIEKDGKKCLRLMAGNRHEEEKMEHFLFDGQQIRVGTFNKLEGDCKTGDVLALYGVDTNWFTSNKTGKTYFSYQCHSTKIRQMSNPELCEEWSHLDQQYYRFSDPREEDWRQPTIIMRIGWADEASSNLPKGCFTTPPDITERSTFYYEKDETEGKKAMFSAPGYRTYQWSTSDTGEETVQVVYTDCTLFQESIGKNYGITNVEDWITFGPQLVTNMKGVFLGWPNKEKTSMYELNDETFQSDLQKQYKQACVEAKQNKEDLPEPPPNFAVKVNVRRFLSSPAYNIKNVAIEVPMEFVRDSVFKKSDGKPEFQASSQFAQGNPWNNDFTVGWVNMNEMYGDRKKYYDNPNNKYWFISNADLDEGEQAELNEMSLEERLVAFGGGKKKALFKWKKGLVFVEKNYGAGVDNNKRKAPASANKGGKKKKGKL